MPEGYEIKWVGHNDQGNHDKVWGWLQMDDGRIYCFWGRRGKKLRFKLHTSIPNVERVRWEKEDRKGYCIVLPHLYDKLVKDFLQEVEIWCATAILGDEVM